MKNFLNILLLVLVMAIVNGCYYDKEADLYPNTGNGLCDTTGTTYSGSVAAIISGNCLSCHRPGGAASTNGDYSTFAGIKANIDNGKIQDRITNATKPMPPTGLLPSCDIRKIQAWIASGYPQN